MKTIIFYANSLEDSTTSLDYLINDIKDRDDAQHKLFFSFLMAQTYRISMGTQTDDGERHFVGEHEVIFIPSGRQQDIDRLKETKDVIFYKNCMSVAGPQRAEKRQKLIDWLLEITEEINL